MPDFALIDLSGPSIIGEPGPLPEMFMPRDRVPRLGTLADLSFTAPDYGGAYSGRGYWPVVEIRPTPASWQRNAASPTLAVDAANKRVTATYALESRPLADVKAERLATLAAYRYARETGGISLNGAVIRTDRESQALVTGAYSLVQADPERVIDWKGANGWVQLNAAAVTAIALAVGTHIQSCFSKEKEHAQAIAACETAEAAATYDFTTGWPE